VRCAFSLILFLTHWYTSLLLSRCRQPIRPTFPILVSTHRCAITQRTQPVRGASDCFAAHPCRYNNLSGQTHAPARLPISAHPFTLTETANRPCQAPFAHLRVLLSVSPAPLAPFTVSAPW